MADTQGKAEEALTDLLLNNTLVVQRSLGGLVYGVIFIGDLNQLWIVQSAVDEGHYGGQHDLACQATQPGKHLKNIHMPQTLQL